MNASPELSVSPNTSPITPDNSAKNLKNEQEAISIQNIPGSSAQDVQPTNQVNFTGATAGSYVPISSATHMYPTQPSVNFTSGKYIDLFLNYI